MRMNSEIFSELKKILNSNISKKFRKKNYTQMKIPVLFPKIFDYPFTYKSEISETLKSGDFVKAPFGSSEITGVDLAI